MMKARRCARETLQAHFPSKLWSVQLFNQKTAVVTWSTVISACNQCAIEPGSRSLGSAGNRLVFSHGLISPQDQPPLLCCPCELPQLFIRQKDTPPLTDGATFGLILRCRRDSPAEIQLTEVLLCSLATASLFTFNFNIYHRIARSLWNYGQYDVDIIPCQEQCA